MYHFPLHTIPFPSTPRQRCLQIAIIPPSFSHLCLDMFQKTGSFHLPSRCEEICSLMAFKTGSTDNKKKEKWEEVRFAPHQSPTPLQTPVVASFTKPSAAAAAVPRCQLCQSHWPPSAGNLIPSPQPPHTLTEWARLVTVESECHSKLRLGIVFQVCVLLYSLFTAAA